LAGGGQLQGIIMQSHHRKHAHGDLHSVMPRCSYISVWFMQKYAFIISFVSKGFCNTKQQRHSAAQ